MTDQLKPNLWLQVRRQQLRMSQEKLAEKLQVEGQDYTRATVSHWEVGRYQMPLDDPEFRRVLAKILKMSIADMLAAAGYEIDVSHSHAGERAASIVDMLPPDQQDLAIGLLTQLLERT